MPTHMFYCPLLFAVITEPAVFISDPSHLPVTVRTSMPTLIYLWKRTDKPLLGLLFPFYRDVLLHALKRLWAALNPFLLGSCLYLVVDFPFSTNFSFSQVFDT